MQLSRWIQVWRLTNVFSWTDLLDWVPLGYGFGFLGGTQITENRTMFIGLDVVNHRIKSIVGLTATETPHFT